MVDFRFKDDSPEVTAILAGQTAAIVSGDYDNSVLLDRWADFFWIVQWDTGLPNDGQLAGDLYVLHADDAGDFPEFTTQQPPQRDLLSGVFQAPNASTSEDRMYSINKVRLGPRENRIVLHVRAGNTDNNQIVRLNPYTLEVV